MHIPQLNAVVLKRGIMIIMRYCELSSIHCAVLQNGEHFSNRNPVTTNITVSQSFTELITVTVLTMFQML